MEEDAATTALEALEPINLVVIGKDGTGKTALIVRLLTRRFIHEYDPSLGGAVEQVNQAVRRKRAMDAKLSQNRPKTTVVKADDKAEPLTRPPASRHLGAGNAGKIRRAIYSVLLSVYPFTIDDDGESLSINLMDTAGKARGQRAVLGRRLPDRRVPDLSRVGARRRDHARLAGGQRARQTAGACGHKERSRPGTGGELARARGARRAVELRTVRNGGHRRVRRSRPALPGPRAQGQDTKGAKAALPHLQRPPVDATNRRREKTLQGPAADQVTVDVSTKTNGICSGELVMKQ
ncbi:uncharacterized protein LOC144142904 isoform X1 [Haemaphysalis longicornis]